MRTISYRNFPFFFLLLIIHVESQEKPATALTGKSVSFSGLIIDRPKLRVFSYRVRSPQDPNSVISEEEAFSSCSGSGNLESDFLQKNCDPLTFPEGPALGQDESELKEWSTPPNVTELTLRCTSKGGPVEWDYQGHGKFPEMRIESRRIVGDFWSPSTYSHESDLTLLKISDQLTGTFVCRNVEKFSVQNSFYLFVPQEKLPTLDPEVPYSITPSSHERRILIPCRTEDKDASVHLYKKRKDGTLQHLNLASSELRFNPYLGFELPHSPEVYGSYVCKVETEGMKEGNGRDDVEVQAGGDVGTGSDNANANANEGDKEQTEDPSAEKEQESFNSNSKFKKRRNKRSQQLLLSQHFETSTSPGFSAFPTSEELISEVLTPPDNYQRPFYSKSKRPSSSSNSAQSQSPQAGVISKRLGVGIHGAGLKGPNAQGPVPGSRIRVRPLRGPFRGRRPLPVQQGLPGSGALKGSGSGSRPGVIGVPISIVPEVQEVESSASNSNYIPTPTQPPSIQAPAPPTEPESDPVAAVDPNLSEFSGDPIPAPSYPFPNHNYPYQRLPPRVHLPPILVSHSHPHSPGGFPIRLPFRPLHFSRPKPMFHNHNHKLHHPPPTVRPFSPTSSEERDNEKEALAQQSHETFPDGSHDLSPKSPKPRNNSSSSYPFRKPPRKGAGVLLSQNLLPQTMNIMNSMSCVLKKVMLGPEASCNSSFFEAGAAAAAAANAALSRIPITNSRNKMKLENQETILQVEVRKPPANKFFPSEPSFYATVPFFLKWQTRSTDFSNWAAVNHTLKEGTFKLHKAGHFEDNGVHSFEVFNLGEGEEGRISVPFVDEEKRVQYHTWRFTVISPSTFSEKGLTRREEGNKNIFTCKSATQKKPKLNLTKLMDDGCPIKDPAIRRKLNKKKSVVEEDCGPGCASIRTDVDTGLVTCKGDGVDATLRFPSDLYCTGRPYFVERGKTKNLTLPENRKKLLIPCVINNPNADVYLFHQNANGTITDVTDSATYDLKLGFNLNLEKFPEPLGTYACTSTTNVEDDSDMVTYHVNPAAAHVFNPSNPNVFGTPPFRFVWESVEELEVQNKSLGNFYSGVFAKPEGNRPFVGTFEISSLEKGQSGVVTLLRSKDKEVVHSWNFSYSGKYGLWIDKKLNLVKCRSTAGKPPSLFAVECSNPNECRLKKRFVEDEDPDRETVECGSSCTELKIWKNQPFGFVKCLDRKDDPFGSGSDEDGMEDSMNYFLSSNSTLVSESDDLEAFKHVEISSPVRQLRVGETLKLQCKASKYFYSKGFQWGIEMKDGSKKFLDATSGKEGSFGLTSLRSDLTLRIDSKSWKTVWCYAPRIDSNKWGQASQLLYIQ